MKFNKKKLEAAARKLEAKANYINMEYYYPKFLKVTKLLEVI